MEKNLSVYPIASGDVLNVFANSTFCNIKILDMHGNLVHSEANKGSKAQLDITGLTNNTYIVEVLYNDDKTARSVFVKTT